MQHPRDQQAGPAAHPPRSAFARRMLAAAGLLLFALFFALGTWQVVRLQWKLDLIERVESRVHAAPVAAPGPERWSQVSRDTDEYRRVRVAGHYLYEFTAPVQALSELGAGFWLLTPLCTAEGHIVFINRGFIPAAENKPGTYAARRAAADPCAHGGERVEVSGLLRISEPGGGFLRENDPANNRWFSRDVQALAAARGLTNVAPYFIDAGKNQDPAGAPERAVGGLTVISFTNNHLVYALTWYALALMVGAAWWWIGGHGAVVDDD
ncbi:SURF1-like protein [Massilia varians]|uniref:SURF1-like protein n=1 Tax=Massilia varians TaxID=457921 RepID=A0ABM8C7S3_9BURK|nr:SURF1 family protein [Massilia varians]BDT59317.1 SURF1-like protein [Massilia varians]